MLTPNGYMRLEGNHDRRSELDQRLGGWEPEEFRALGYELHGLQGLRCFPRAGALPPPLRWLWKPVVYFGLQPLAHRRPQQANDLLAVKCVTQPDTCSR